MVRVDGGDVDRGCGVRACRAGVVDCWRWQRRVGGGLGTDGAVGVKFTLSWLKDHLQTDADATTVADAMTGAMLGTIHGVIVMLLVAIAIMEHHPVARYHEKGLSTGISQLVAHILYGLTVGTVVDIMH